MIQKIKVPDMSCNHCENAIRQALEKLDAVNILEINLDTKDVIVETEAPVERIYSAIRDAGYSPE